jgi:hypothetical protein
MSTTSRTEPRQADIRPPEPEPGLEPGPELEPAPPSRVLLLLEKR